jgi:hypothetical protein
MGDVGDAGRFIAGPFASKTGYPAIEQVHFES